MKASKHEQCKIVDYSLTFFPRSSETEAINGIIEAGVIFFFFTFELERCPAKLCSTFGSCISRSLIDKL